MWFQGKRRHPTIRTIVGEGCTITGELRFTDGLRIDGEVRGDVVGDGPAATLVVIGEKGRIDGTVKAGHVIVSGEVSGAVESDDLLELQPSARIDGDVRYEALEMHKGASISGELRPLDAGERAAESAASDSPDPMGEVASADTEPTSLSR